MNVTQRARLAVPLLGLVVALLGAQSANADDPTLYVRYTMSCTFTITGDNGGVISVIPPGRYQILVTSPQPFAEPDLSDVTDPNYSCGGALSFRLTGPGVSLYTTLEGGGDPSDELQETFQVGTYVAQEDRRPTVTRTVITVSTGAASTGGGSSAGSGGGTSGSSSGGGSSSASNTKSNDKSNVKSEPVGPGPFRGTLSGDVNTIGKLTLKFNGKAVSSLRSGRYTLTVRDETRKTGFTIQKLGQQSVKVTGTTFLGQHSVTLTLKPGQWFFYSSPGKKSYFIVVG
jgi:hypothetical protein